LIIFAYLLGALWFFLPAGIANGIPVILAKLPLLRGWNAPLDGGKMYRGKHVLGKNKTWRGLLGGSLLAGLVALLQYAFNFKLPGFQLVTSPGLAFAIGFLMGFGALIGDAIESFFKRQRDIGPGNAWFPLDQLDYIFGGLLLSYPLAKPSLLLMLTVIIAWFGVHLFSVYAGYLTGLRDKPI
jgi:CDP-2,3-bis-(O-geranylgeranyl)-sn-glycerol synthase